jgi:hypothetical protein
MTMGCVVMDGMEVLLEWDVDSVAEVLTVDVPDLRLG